MGKEDRLLTGIFTGHVKGFGFVTAEGMEEDLYIRAENVNGAMHQDEVQVLLKAAQEGKRREGIVKKVLTRGTMQLVGT